MSYTNFIWFSIEIYFRVYLMLQDFLQSSFEIQRNIFYVCLFSIDFIFRNFEMMSFRRQCASFLPIDMS